jgi:hypothetical protein
MVTVLEHYGIKRRSGRYPWGSGEQPYQSSGGFTDYVKALESEGMSQVEIAKSMGMKVQELRNWRTIAREDKRAEDAAMAQRLLDKGYSKTAIGERMGINESSVRALLDPVLQQRAMVSRNIADALAAGVERHGYIDIGVGSELYLGVPRTKLKVAIQRLKEEGYKVQFVKVEQLGTGKDTSVMVLTKDDVSYPELIENQDKIRMLNDTYSNDGGHTWFGLKPPVSIDSSRISVKYAEDGGVDKDGVIELRPGVDDISLGQSRYAQVRIKVDDTHYLKGMAMYNNNLPDGVDIVFNTNKSKKDANGDIHYAMKKLKDDPDNPFGADVTRGQYYYKDKNGNEKLSAINKVNDEGSWMDWSKNISSQMLSKQRPALAKQQLDLAKLQREDEFNEINSLTNPVVKKRLMAEFADKADAAAVHLKAAGLPRQAWSVILPVTDLKENEIYAPNHRDGETVVLIRYPHGGTFEIPELKVNNRHKTARDILGNAVDAVGINPKVAQRLSGADFDGDTVLVIPNNNKTIKTSPALAGLKGFDPHASFPKRKGMRIMKEESVGRHMGDVSNLITDMTIQGASPDELARAVRHSMVVIDAYKHKLDYKLSREVNGIDALKRKYQGSARAGAATLISKAKSQAHPYHRKERYHVDKDGNKVYDYTGESYINKDGKLIKRKIRSTKMAETKDAMTLSSGTIMERVYGKYANSMKELARKARLVVENTQDREYSRSAKEAYPKEVESLNKKLSEALMNAPLERRAQIIANATIKRKRATFPDLKGKDLKKEKGMALTEARVRVGAKKKRIEITDREWKAIQAGAISNHKLNQILLNSDMNRVRQLATPRSNRRSMTPIKVTRARNLLAAGYTRAQVADAVGVSVSTLYDSLDEGKE